MAKKFDPKELVSFEELLISNSIQIEALTQFDVKLRYWQDTCSRNSVKFRVDFT